MTGLEDPARFAALIAPAVDRVVIAVHLGAAERIAAVKRRHGVAGPIGSLVELRLPFMAGLPVARAAYDAIARYVPDRDREVEVQVGHGRLCVTPAGELVATPAGRALVADLVAAFEAVIAERWAYRAATVPGLDALAARAVEAGRGSGGAAFALAADSPLPPAACAAFVLWTHLAALRYHRADAHAAAWAAAGLTVEEVVAAPWDERRRRIEDDTDRRAAPVWASLDPDERLALLAGLAGL